MVKTCETRNHKAIFLDFVQRLFCISESGGTNGDEWIDELLHPEKQKKTVLGFFVSERVLVKQP